MTEQITDLERCWFLSPPWGQEIPPVEINLSEKVYFKTDRTFGYCCGVQWYGDCWNYIIEIKNDFIYATKDQIIATGNIQPSTVKKPSFVLGERVLLQFGDRGTKQRLILGIELIEKSWFYLVELASPSFSASSTMTNRFSLVREEDLVRVRV
ncbi:DUF1392 domain-containing protein (plasmid) [Anabaena sp. FACHB-709]|uniref:DUF1392 domain-containing protein n=2 Tax=Nostocaceae TaxID=1162 RepID=A0A1Z4KUK1_ANAVA|nr:MULTISPECIES: DUF1392 domain-containing protein [Nostocaceae]BAY72669.1 hypothetical protein NIES23_54970 [Trichormus variabilis NIES-23]MBD2174372.1 DUF1392 domain-containing protein [Anabaena cylindrica FACHB-318]MBD2266145.1 DUF1392 domain-containing protein [Anabaena sp. FACHB-709]MBD2275553.1 DUF1392 domain-containing protein [Nostoc sp. PCC 7120 = FACHB-418]MBD2286457.1 DUF1392 domain-containing protein [Anabaena cylindrica FACHB-170]